MDGLNANTSFDTFANVIWAILEQGSTLSETDLEVGQNCAVLRRVVDN